MPIPSHTIVPGAERAIMPPICLGAPPWQASFGARNVGLRERLNLPHRHTVTATPNPESAFSRIRRVL